ncbi:MAG TPA: cytochrome ubiquinol oxidase subunit I [Ktedonobacteraceae bacterium]|jgi:cytochrome d ubiquinol oxidase subunit I|nr:cytochrome ubiquinol oxidase subunit I [Ktedonobacteraceae bacterium]
MPNLLAARSQMGLSLGFHIIFSALGVGLPLILCIAEGLALLRKDGSWMALARQWTKAFAILFAVGSVSGVIVEFELSLLWPRWISFAGALIGLPFAMEGFAFFLEGIFLGIYLYGWNRLSPVVHWMCSLPIVLSGLFSAWFVVSANSWMNSPSGFQMVNGKAVNINPFAAILNPSTPFETTHMILACYVVVGFGTAAVYAAGMLRGKRDDYHRKGLLLGMALAVVAIPLQIVSGDFNARFLEQGQPAKYAAIEGLVTSGYGLPLYIGGIADPTTGQVYGALEIPHGESLLAHFDLNSYARGINEIPAQDHQTAGSFEAVHLAFDGMVFIAFFSLLVAVVFWLLFLSRKRRVPENKLVLWGAAIAGSLSFIAVELGWIVTEEGRQPWIIYNLMLVRDAPNPAQWITVSFIVFSCIYVLLGTTLIVLLLRLARRPKTPMVWNEFVQREEEGEEQRSQGLERKKAGAR